MKQFEKTLSGKKLYDGKIVNVRIDQVEVNQQQQLREVVEHPGGVCVLAINHKHEALVVEQFRYGIKAFMLELPAGKKEVNEAPLLTAKRELLEETGYQAKTWLEFGIFHPSPAYLDEVIYLYVATDLVAKSQQLDEGEYLDSFFLNLDTLKAKIINNEITDGKTIALILRYLASEEKNRE